MLNDIFQRPQNEAIANRNTLLTDLNKAWSQWGIIKHKDQFEDNIDWIKLLVTQ